MKRASAEQNTVVPIGSISWQLSWYEQLFHAVTWRLATWVPQTRRWMHGHLQASRMCDSGNPYLRLASRVPGDLSAGQATALFNAVADAPEGDCLEIGTYCGQASLVIGGAMAERNSKSRLWCCDPFNHGLGCGSRPQRKYNITHLHHLLCIANLSRRTIVFPGEPTELMIAVKGTFALVYIDVRHACVMAEREILSVADLILPGGLIILRDRHRVLARTLPACRNTLDRNPNFSSLQQPANAMIAYTRKTNAALKEAA